MFRYPVAALIAAVVTIPTQARITPFPASFDTQVVQTNGTSLYVRVGGKGPAVVLLHGFGDTGDMWAPLAAELVKDHTVIVPDLRGMGLSMHPDSGYTKKNQAVDPIWGLRAGGAIPRAYYALGRDRRSAPRHWRLGQYHPQPCPMALQFPRTGCRAACAGPRTHLSRPFLE